MNENTIIRTVPAANELHKVPGFDPLKHLRKTVNKAGEPVMRLDLPYKRLWFRLACPNGRLLLNPLRVTDQMAIFEAQVFFNRDDSTPASSFTSDKRAQEIRSYIRAAQDEALNEALDNAGFGIQLCDVVQVSDGRQYSSDIPLAQNEKEQAVKTTAPTHAVEEPQVQEAAHIPTATKQTDQQAAVVHVQMEDSQPAQQTETAAHIQEVVSQPLQETVGAVSVPVTEVSSVDETTTPAPGPKEAPAPVQTEQQRMEQIAEHPEQPLQSNTTNSVVTVLNFPTPQSDNAGAAETPVSTGSAAEIARPEAPVQAAPSYTDDMTVEEILQHMTLDEALAFQIKTGICKGWTLAQVAERRSSSLNYYRNSCCTGGNILKAAATLVLQHLNQQKAG